MGGCSSKSSSANATVMMETSREMQQRRPPKAGHVYLQDATLRLLGVDGPLRFASFNAPELADGSCHHPFEVVDTMRTISGLAEDLPLKVTRTYTFRIKSHRFSDPNKVHVMGWNSSQNEWDLNERCMQEVDHVLNEAAKYNVKLIIPFIDQSTGWASDWVGDTVDLTCLRMGIAQYHEGQKVNFWTNQTVVDSFKQLITQILSRTNTLNGKRYSDDPTVLAWETGNETNAEGMGKTPPPGTWTVQIAKHIKSLAPHTLVMDGSFARSGSMDPKSSYAPEVLSCPDVDILSYHFYGEGDAKRAAKDAKFARKHGKAWIAGEYGFFERLDSYLEFLRDCEESFAAGSLIWSLRPHAGMGGFKTHQEDESNFSYHVPGREPPLPSNFDPKEAMITRLVREANYSINKLSAVTSSPPVLYPPTLWSCLSSTGLKGLSWQGTAWATHYEIWCDGVCLFADVHDSFEEGSLHVAIPRAGRCMIIIWSAFKTTT